MVSAQTLKGPCKRSSLTIPISKYNIIIINSQHEIPQVIFRKYFSPLTKFFKLQWLILSAQAKNLVLSQNVSAITNTFVEGLSFINKFVRVRTILTSKVPLKKR